MAVSMRLYLLTVLGVGVVTLPLRVVEVVSAVVDVIGDQPGYRGNVGVPGPGGLVRMAVA